MEEGGKVTESSEVVFTRAADSVREQYRLIQETQRQCQAVMIAIAGVMGWGPVQLNQIIGAPFFNVPPPPPPPPAELEVPA